MFLGLWRGVNPERLACLQGRPLHRSIDAACILEQESPAECWRKGYARQRHHSKMAASYQLDFIEPQIGLAPFDLLTPKTMT